MREKWNSWPCRTTAPLSEVLKSHKASNRCGPWQLGWGGPRLVSDWQLDNHDDLQPSDSKSLFGFQALSCTMRVLADEIIWE